MSLPDLVQNILLYVPFGALAALSMGAVPVRRPAIGLAVLTAIVMSLTVESLQLFMVDRTASIIDVIAAAIGATAGALIADHVANYAQRAAASAPPRLASGASGTVLMIIVVAITIASWWPFDVTLDVSTTMERLRAQRAALLNDPAPVWLLIAKSALFGGLSYVVGAGLRTAPRAGRVIAVAIMVAFAIALDAGQGLMGARPAGLATLCWQLTGIAGGTAVAVMSRATP